MGGRKKKGKGKRRGAGKCGGPVLCLFYFPPFVVPFFQPALDSWSQPAEVMGNVLRF